MKKTYINPMTKVVTLNLNNSIMQEVEIDNNPISGSDISGNSKDEDEFDGGEYGW